MSKHELSEEAQRLLKLIPPDGSFAGNTSLRRKSGLEEKYWSVRNELDQGGFITLGRGRGGSMALQLSTATPISREETASDQNVVEEEVELYEPLKKLLNEDWGNDAREAEDFFELRVTASPKGRARDSGQWSRPDLTLIEVNTFEFLPGSNLEVTTFEVKKFSDVQNIASVYEAAAHSRWAHYAYLVAEVPSDEHPFPDRFISELARFGVGLILIWREDGKWKFTVETEPERLTPEPKELESLLKTFFSDSKRKKEFMGRVGK